MRKLLSALRLPALLVGLSGALALASLGVSALVARADLKTDLIPDRVPYAGTLMQGGTPYTGDVQLVFRLYDGLATGSAGWSETQTAHVVDGRFALLLGATSDTSGSALRDMIEGADDLYLAVSKLEADGVTEVAFPGRRRFVAAPASLVAKAFSNATIHTRAAIASTRTVDGAGTDGALVVADGDGATLTVDGNDLDSAGGPLSLNRLSLKGVTTGGTLDIAGMALELSDGTTSRTAIARSGNIVTVNPNKAFTTTVIDSPVSLGVGDVKGLTATMRGQGATNYQVLGDLGGGSATYTCPNNAFIYGGRFVGNISSGKAIYTIQCGKVSLDVK
ncbi:MAG: hypothetical protein U1F43_21200 [Myxococcota bacterium]